MQVTLKLQNTINQITDFCLVNRGQIMAWASTRDKMFRFVAFCVLTGKIAVAWDNNNVKAVFFYWMDYIEHIEMKAEQHRPQFEWNTVRKGDALFVGDVIGSRHFVSQIINASLAEWPILLTTPVYTLRRGKLVKISMKVLHRFTL
jgi:hypothetical protein